MVTVATDSVFLLNTVKSIILFPFFLFAVFFAFYIPGELLLEKLKQRFSTFFERVTVSLILGITLWSYQGILFGYLHIRFLTYIYVLLCFFLFVQHHNKDQFWKKVKLKKLKLFHHKKNFYILCIIFFLGIFGQTQKFWVGGSLASDGMHLFASAPDDALWHTSLTAQIVRRFPPFEPGLVDVSVRNYHYWSNVVIAELVRVFRLPLLLAQYQYMYLLVSFLMGAVAYTLAKRLRFSTYAISFLVYLQYFSSDVLYLFTFVASHVFNFTIGPLEGGVELLENPPRAFSNVVGFCAILFLSRWIEDKKITTGILTIFLFASLMGFKANTGIVWFIGLAVVTFILFIKLQFKMVLISLCAVLLALAIYLPVNKNAGGLLFTPFWITRDFVMQPGLNLHTLELARQTYQAHSNFLQTTRMDITMLVLFLLAQFGVRNLGWIPTKQFIKRIGIQLYTFLLTAMISGVILGTFFYQQSGGANIFNFFLSSSLLLSLPSAFLIGKLLQTKFSIQIFIIAVLIIVTLPRWIYRTETSFLYFQKTDPVINSGELAAMDVVSKKSSTDTILLVDNKGTWDSRYPYVSAFTQRDMYLSGQWILESHGIYEFKQRQKIANTIFTSSDPNEIKNLLIKNNITLLFFYGNPQLGKGLKQVSMEKFFQNNGVTIYRYEKQ